MSRYWYRTSVRIAIFVVVALFSIGRRAEAQVPPVPNVLPPFTYSVTGPVSSPVGPVTHSGTFRIVTPYMFDAEGSRVHDWYVKADATGQLVVTLVLGREPYGCGVCPPIPSAPPFGTMTATLYRDATPIGSVAVTTPAFSPPAATGTITATTTPGEVLGLRLTGPSGPVPLIFYRVKFDGAEQAGLNSPADNTTNDTRSVASSDQGGTSWVMNVNPGESLNVNVLPGPPGFPTATLINTYVTIFDPNHNQVLGPMLVNSTGGSFAIPGAGATPGPWVVQTGSPSSGPPSSPYRLRKTSGADRGLYVAWFTSGEGDIRLLAISPPSVTSIQAFRSILYQSPFKTDVGATTGQTNVPGGDPFEAVGQNHFTITAPPGYAAVPSEVDFPITADGITSVVIHIVDVAPPTLTLPPNIIEEANTTNGAVVYYSTYAYDANDGVVAVTCSPASGGTFPLFPVGTTTVNCSASDLAGNTATGSFTVTVVDTTPPALSCPSSLTAYQSSAYGAIVTFTPTASDIAGAVTVTSSPASGSVFPLGTTTVNVTAVDRTGNRATCSFTVTILTPVSTVGVKSTDGGTIDVPGGRGTFGIVANSTNAGVPTGHVEYQDHVTGMNLKSTQITAVLVSGTHARIFGIATINGAGSYYFVVDVDDLGEPGIGSDQFGIQVSNGYSVGSSTLTGGNIQIHK